MFACFMMTNTYGQAKEDSATTKNADTSSYYVHPRNTEAGRVLNHVYELDSQTNRVFQGHILKYELDGDRYQMEAVKVEDIPEEVKKVFPGIKFFKTTKTYPPSFSKGFGTYYVPVYNNKSYTPGLAFNQLVKDAAIPNLSLEDKAIAFVKMTLGLYGTGEILEIEKDPVFNNDKIEIKPDIKIKVKSDLYPYNGNDPISYFIEFDQDGEIVKSSVYGRFGYSSITNIFKSYSYE